MSKYKDIKEPHISNGLERYTKMKTKTITIEIGDNWKMLWSCGMENFIKKQRSRFYLIEGKPNNKGYMYWCETYLEAKVLMSFLGATTLYSDDCDGLFVVIDPKATRCTK